MTDEFVLNWLGLLFQVVAGTLVLVGLVLTLLGKIEEWRAEKTAGENNRV